MYQEYKAGITATAPKVYNANFYLFEQFVLDYILFCRLLDCGRP